MGELLQMPPDHGEHEPQHPPRKRSNGRAPVVREHELQAISKLARTGATEEDIAAELQIPLKRLKKRYRREIEKSRAIAKNEMLAHLYETAKSRSNTAATMFWVKTQCGWRDTGASETILLKRVMKITRRPLAL